MNLHYSDSVVVEGLRQKKSSCIAYLYDQYGPVVRHLVKQNSGNQQDMEDLFQDAIIVLYKRSLSETFKLECSLKTYFISICKNLWLQRLDRKFRLLYQADFELNEPGAAYLMEDPDFREETLEQRRLFYKHLQSLPTDCQQIIRLYCLKVSCREIARLLNLKDEVYVKTRKYSCKNLLRKKIMNDPECRQYLNYEKDDNHQ